MDTTKLLSIIENYKEKIKNEFFIAPYKFRDVSYIKNEDFKISCLTEKHLKDLIRTSFHFHQASKNYFYSQLRDLIQSINIKNASVIEEREAYKKFSSKF